MRGEKNNMYKAVSKKKDFSPILNELIEKSVIPDKLIN